MRGAGDAAIAICLPLYRVLDSLVPADRLQFWQSRVEMPLAENLTIGAHGIAAASHSKKGSSAKEREPNALLAWLRPLVQTLDVAVIVADNYGGSAFSPTNRPLLSLTPGID
jgi:hypothetical protein